MFSKISIKYVVVLCFIKLAAATFRCDYTYFPEGGGWYKLHPAPAHWHLAKQLCQHEGGALVQPVDSVMVGVITQLMEEQGIGTPVHTALRTIFTLEGDTDSKHLYDNEIPVRERSVIKEQVLVLWSNGTLEQTDTFMWFPFVCHVSAADSVRLNKCGTVDNGYILDSRTDHCYKFHRTRSDWNDARRICAAEGGNLAVINSDLEAEAIKDIFLWNPEELIPGRYWKDSAFVGVMLSSDGVWVTTTGLPLSASGYEAWCPGEPNNANGDEFCGSVGRNGLLFDDPCSRLMPFICELERNSLLYCDRDKTISDTKTLLRSILRGESHLNGGKNDINKVFK